MTEYGFVLRDQMLYQCCNSTVVIWSPENECAVGKQQKERKKNAARQEHNRKKKEKRRNKAKSRLMSTIHPS